MERWDRSLALIHVLIDHHEHIRHHVFVLEGDRELGGWRDEEEVGVGESAGGRPGLYTRRGRIVAIEVQVARRAVDRYVEVPGP